MVSSITLLSYDILIFQYLHLSERKFSIIFISQFHPLAQPNREANEKFSQLCSQQVKLRRQPCFIYVLHPSLHPMVASLLLLWVSNKYSFLQYYLKQLPSYSIHSKPIFIMSSVRSLAPLVRRSVVATRANQSSLRGGASPPLPPFARSPVPTQKVRLVNMYSI